MVTDYTFDTMDDCIEDDKPMEQLHINRPAIVLVGKTGSGKSMLGNRLHAYLTGDSTPVFQEGHSMYSETQIAKSRLVEIKGKQFDLVDTPGIFDTSGTDHQVLDEVTRTIQQCTYGVQALIFVIEYGRLTWEMKEIVNAIIKFFGADVKSNMILMFNRVDGNMALNRELLYKELVREPLFRRINPIRELVLAIDNRWILSTSNFFPKGDEIWIREAKHLVDQIASFPKPYTTDMFERIREERELKEEVERRARQEEEDRRKIVEDEWAILRSEAETNRMDAESLRAMLESQQKERERMEQSFNSNLAKMKAEHKVQMEQRAREEAEMKVGDLQKFFEELKRESAMTRTLLEQLLNQKKGCIVS